MSVSESEEEEDEERSVQIFKKSTAQKRAKQERRAQKRRVQQAKRELHEMPALLQEYGEE